MLLPLIGDLVGDVFLTSPKLLWAIPGIAVFLLALLLYDFVNLPLSPDERRRQRRTRCWIFLSRLLIITMLVIALAHPYIERTKAVKGNPRVTLLVDTSASMAVLDTKFADGLADLLGRHVPTTVRPAGTNLTSDIGSAALRNLEPGGYLLLLTDGNVNEGAALEDVAFYASTLNATVSSIDLTATASDAGILLLGPSKVVADSDATFNVIVTATAPDATANLKVLVDGSVVLDKRVSPGTYSFTKQFSTGDHRIEAALDGGDAVSANDRFFKAVHVLPKPRILLVSVKNSPLELLLRDLYDVDKRPNLPADLSPYYAVVVDDAPIESLRNTKVLHDYLIDETDGYYGGGLVLFGGMDSFDRGAYSGSALEPLLPVKVGKGERKKGNANLVFLVDVSGSTAKTKYVVQDGRTVQVNESLSTLDVIKAQVVNAVGQLKLENKVSVIVFGVPPDVSLEGVEDRIADTVKIIEKLDFLYNNRQEILTKVPRIVGGGPTAADVAFRGAVEMLKNAEGDKNVILMTDGRYSAGLGAESPMKKQLLTLASNAHKLYGVNFMTIGTGTTSTDFSKKVDETFLKELAKAGDGTYDRATQLNSLLVKWGDPKAKNFGEEFVLVPLSLTHFITRDLEPTAVLNAYSEVVPKDTAELLIAADSGQPALTVWRYGNGRVATWTVFAGNNLGQLLNGENSLLLSRTVNWAIGDPQRKQPYFVDIPDTRMNEQGFVTVKSDAPVTSDTLVFVKDGSVYTARFDPSSEGFAQLLGLTYAINRPSELDRTGMNPFLAELVTTTGGKVFKPSESDAMIEHIKEVSKRVTVTKQDAAMPFLIAALALLLLEFALRRITDRRRNN